MVFIEKNENWRLKMAIYEMNVKELGEKNGLRDDGFSLWTFTFTIFIALFGLYWRINFLYTCSFFIF